MKKILAFIVVALVAINLYGASEVTSGECGDNLSWEYSDGVLTISGTGYMYNYRPPRDLAPWFDICDKIKSVMFYGQIESIGDYAFEYCSGLTSITIPSSVTEIGDYAFEYCSGLTSITIPSSVTKIGYCAFLGCSGLTSITIPSSVTRIGGFAFSCCSGLASIKVASSNSYYDSRNNCNAIIERSTNELIAGCKNTIIPSSVTEIGDYAFEYCSGLTSITIPSSVTSIGSSAFYDCSGLTSITIPSSVTEIGARAFSGCSGLTSITIPSSVTEIGDYAFVGCSGLTSITIPNSVTEIGSSAFSGCSGLASIKVASSNSYYDSRNNCNAIIERSTNELIAGCKNTIIPNSVTEIGSSAFSGCSGLTSITIPSSVTRIGESTFSGCSGLTLITIPNSVTEIGYSAFWGCEKLSSVFVGSVNPPEIYNSSFSNIADDAVLYVPYGSLKAYNVAPWNTFFSKIQEVKKCGDNLSWEYSDGVLTISGTGYMYNYYYPNNAPWYDIRGKIKSVMFYGQIESIGSYAFHGCSGLTSITIPSSVTEIGNWAFRDCSGLTSITIPSSVTEIGDYAFDSCFGLTSITIPSSVTEIGAGAFWGCSGLASIKVASSNSYYDSRNNCNAIIERSTNELIAGCKNTIIPNSVTSIGSWAFSGCSGLTSITIPNSVTEIGAGTFRGCSGLTLITIPSSVTKIVYRAFEDCSGLTSITLPGSVTEIGAGAFWGCKKLSSVFVESVNPPEIDNSFSNIADDAVLYVPYGSLKAYNIAPWNTFFSKIQEVKKCGDNLFCEYSKGVLTITGTGDMYDFDIDDDYISTAPWSEYSNEVESIVFDGEITSIGDYAFEDFTALTSVTIPNSVKRIGEYVFDGCTSLRLLKIGNGVTSIGEFAFARCSLLSSIIIPNSVTDINDYAFYYCEFLTSVKIGNGVRSIGDYAFYGCFSLTFVTCEAIEVPRLFSQTFGEVRVDKATLYVPVESLELYKNAYIWRDFYNILPIANTGVEDVFAPKTESETTKIFYKGNIYILRDGKVYTLMGQEVYDIPM